MSRAPTGEEEARFWHLIDSAWERVGPEASARRKGLANREGDDEAYDLDRADIHEVTGGGDDGFLYSRGFIVAMGREFYEAVRADPAVAVMDADCEEMC